LTQSKIAPWYLPVDEMGAVTKVQHFLTLVQKQFSSCRDSTVSMLEKTLSPPGSPQNLFQSKTPGMAAIVRPRTL
jgi:hypothetical protein